MRGKVTARLAGAVHFGITPACAGKSACCRHSSRRVKDHPRVCGEKRKRSCCRRCDRGSPPRVRGKGSASWTVNLRQRITPACAGKSSTAKFGLQRSKDHPRVCGEKAERQGRSFPLSGSPPRVRGKVEKNRYVQIGTRITPACAGKSLKLSPSASCHRDHPRVCGEKRTS